MKQPSIQFPKLLLQDWSGADWSNQQSNGEVGSWSREASVEQPAPPPDPAAPEAAPVIDPNADIWKAVVLFTFQANNEDEINITENEQVDIMVKECDEEGWVMVRNSSGVRGYAPTNYLEVFASESLAVPASSQPMQTIPENSEPPPVTGGWADQNWGGGNQQEERGECSGEKILVRNKIAGGWAAGRGAETETEGESETEAETEDEGPPPGCTICSLQFKITFFQAWLCPHRRHPRSVLRVQRESSVLSPYRSYIHPSASF